MKNSVYLAGGFYGTWNRQVREANPALVFLDPRIKEFAYGERVRMTVGEYSTLDKHMIRQCDIVFVYAENTNPGFGYAMEAAYAKGLGKTVILVLEENNQTIDDRYLEFLTAFADITFDNLEEGINYLQLFQ